MRQWIVLLLLLVPTFSQAAPPNVVLIFVDDLGISDLGCYGRAEHRTPNLDQLAREGIRFTNAYAGASICSPTRAALMTGMAPARLHITTFLPGRADAPSQKLLHPKIASNLPNEQPTLPGLLRDRGYVTASFGKWHLGGKGHQPTDHGFQSHYAGKANTQPGESEGGKGEYDLTAKATAFIRENAKRPFFVYLAHNTPHIPYKAKPETVAKNKDAFEPTYAALIESLDVTVGQLLGALNELKLAENTLVIFTSDNGGLHVPELNHKRITHTKPYRAGKGYLYEGGLRVPLILRWPSSIKAGQVTDTPAITQDLLPTILACAGAEVPKCDGVSLLGLCQGKPLASRSLYWHQPHYTNQGGRPGGAIRDGNWKFIYRDEDGRAELYNLAKDPGERTNLAAEQPERVKQFTQQLEQWRTSVNAQRNRPNPNFDKALFEQLYVKFDPSKYDPTDPKQEPLALEWRKGMDAVTRKK